MNVQLFKPIAKIPGVSLYSLQKVSGTDQLDDISFVVHDFGSDFDTKHGRFMDTAAIIKNLDLIITVDTSISHLAAALGAPTWILLPEPSDWRWMTTCTDTPWYPNVKLFRQPHVGDWKGAVEKVTKELIPLVENHKKTPKKPIVEKETFCNLDKLEIDEFLDTMTRLALYSEKDQIPYEIEIEQAETLYKQYCEKYPQLKQHSQQLLNSNRYLLTLKKQIVHIDHDIFNPKYIDLAHKVSKTTKCKEEIKKEIRDIIQ